MLGSPTVLAGHNDAGKSAIIHAILFLLDGYTLTESDRTYVNSTDGTVSPRPDGSIDRVAETYVAGTFDLDEDETELFKATTLEVRRVARSGGKPVLEVLRSVPTDARLRGLETLTVPQLLDRLATLEIDTSKGNKTDYLERLEIAANWV